MQSVLPGNSDGMSTELKPKTGLQLCKEKKVHLNCLDVNKNGSAYLGIPEDIERLSSATISPSEVQFWAVVLSTNKSSAKSEHAPPQRPPRQISIAPLLEFLRYRISFWPSPSLAQPPIVVASPL